MKNQVVHTPDSHSRDFSEIVSFLYTMRKGKKNHALLTEYLLQEFATHPQELVQFIHIVKSELENPNNPERERMARRYLFVFSFLCERFGLYEEKLELDDLCFEITEPQEYKNLKKQLENYQKKSQKIIDEIFATFQTKIQESGIQAELKGRYKNILSIHKKCRKKKLKDALRLNDIFAFRIIVDGDTEDCYEVLNILHDSFIPIPSRYKDYVTIPKINGYQSIHTGLLWVSSDLDLAIEIQIRTKIMDEIAEWGIAAHFLYARDKSSKKITDKEQKLMENMEKVQESIKINPHIHCLTPQGDIIRLERGSTALDFANKIHTGLARKAKSALVNNTNRPLTHELQSFDFIEIVTK